VGRLSATLELKGDDMLKRLMGTTVLFAGLLTGGALWGHGTDNDNGTRSHTDLPGSRSAGSVPTAGSTTGGNGTGDSGSTDTGTGGKKHSGHKKHKGAGGSSGSGSSDTM
jgi:hypothetical protein